MINPFVILIIAVLGEVFGNSMLKQSNGFKRLLPSLGVIFGMGIAFYGLSLTLTAIPLSTAYAVWSGAGTALTALIGVLVYKEKFNFKKIIGLVFIIGGVISLKLSSGV
ncbi:multidrug efflux SMR transporter [Virgibacillus sp. AGTR]|uniref:Multidrug efflux SMR transporter n=1 Tax=Virgibacillus salarius TaxID=447199 RepID=A0A941ICW2_9BACI|nr:multidrug efflux SMR transporter [Virgibacillus salarius]MBR7797926.1 multidrug efflux SMR transporter [Virgibacillus salarius]MCC2248476.1 multidrug efflux SMR transporter [Virgibacillus sp. AGTR]QRZ16660.1 multidrug efflux SMR transporter [Virgibacillus sp. AGTR]